MEWQTNGRIICQNHKTCSKSVANATSFFGEIVFKLYYNIRGISQRELSEQKLLKLSYSDRMSLSSCFHQIMANCVSSPMLVFRKAQEFH